MIHASKLYATAVMRINYPTHKGQPNPKHGWHFLVGTIPAGCWDQTRNDGTGGSRLYETEAAAILDAVRHGAEVVQRCNCTRADVAGIRAALDQSTT